MKKKNFIKSNKNLILCRDYENLLSLFIYIFAFYPRESSSPPFRVVPCNLLDFVGKDMNKLWSQKKSSANCNCRQKITCRQKVPVGKTICRQNGVGKMIVGKV
jgi:hypothetical protein